MHILNEEERKEIIHLYNRHEGMIKDCPEINMIVNQMCIHILEGINIDPIFSENGTYYLHTLVKDFLIFGNAYVSVVKNEDDSAQLVLYHPKEILEKSKNMADFIESESQEEIQSLIDFMRGKKALVHFRNDLHGVMYGGFGKSPIGDSYKAYEKLYYAENDREFNLEKINYFKEKLIRSFGLEPEAVGIAEYEDYPESYQIFIDGMTGTIKKGLDLVLEIMLDSKASVGLKNSEILLKNLNKEQTDKVYEILKNAKIEKYEQTEKLPEISDTEEESSFVQSVIDQLAKEYVKAMDDEPSDSSRDEILSSAKKDINEMIKKVSELERVEATA